MTLNAKLMLDKILNNQKCISLTTYKKNGNEVSTPVWFARDTNDVYFMTESQSWKAKRIRKNPKVAFVSCGYMGRVRRRFKDLRIHGEAEFIEGEDVKKAEKLMAKKYWLLYRFLRNNKYVFLRISPTAILKEPDEEEEACG